MGGSASADLDVPFAAAGKERMDQIVVDETTRAVSRVAGAERDEAQDALEWQGDVSGRMVVGRAQVTDSAVRTVETGLWRGVRRIGRHHAEDARIARNRDILSSLIADAEAGNPIKIGSYGDSITAQQIGLPAYTANGPLRDRASEAYLASYPADTRATLPLYDTGDGAGQVHTRLGWNWAIKAALEALGGSAVSYLNYGIASTTSSYSEPVPGRGNGRWPARIAEPLAAGLDAVVIAFGIGELGHTGINFNMTDMIQQFQNAGVLPIVMGVPRPNASVDVTGWHYTNDALESAALDEGAAFISTTTIADEGLALGGIGVPADALCSANMYNHPGIWELNRYGETAVHQLGLG